MRPAHQIVLEKLRNFFHRQEHFALCTDLAHFQIEKAGDSDCRFRQGMHPARMECGVEKSRDGENLPHFGPFEPHVTFLCLLQDLTTAGRFDSSLQFRFQLLYF